MNDILINTKPKISEYPKIKERADMSSFKGDIFKSVIFANVFRCAG